MQSDHVYVHNSCHLAWDDAPVHTLQRFCRFIVKAADYPRVHCKVHVVRSSITSLNWRV